MRLCFWLCAPAASCRGSRYWSLVFALQLRQLCSLPESVLMRKMHDVLRSLRCLMSCSSIRGSQKSDLGEIPEGSDLRSQLGSRNASGRADSGEAVAPQRTSYSIRTGKPGGRDQYSACAFASAIQCLVELCRGFLPGCFQSVRWAEIAQSADFANGAGSSGRAISERGAPTSCNLTSVKV